jgi:hypothetical protein
MQPEPIELNVGNVADGVVPELFDTEIRKILSNIADVNTPADAKRKLTIDFDFAPTPDRKSAVVTVTAKTKLQGMEGKAGTIYFRKSQVTQAIEAYAEDPRQDILFARDKPASPSAQ